MIWAGPVGHWIKACDLILGWDAETIVPGHGPITDKNGIRQFKTYLDYIRIEAQKRFDAGLDYIEAAKDIALDAYADWGDAERIVANVATLYREFSGSKEQHALPEIFAAMEHYRQKHGGPAG